METGRPIIGLVESRQLGDGQTNWTLATKLPLRDESGNVIGLVGITRDINEIRQTEVALQHLATHDPLTDLPNRFLMDDRLSQVLARAKRSGTSFAVLYMDIDRFKDVNDTRGHEFGRSPAPGHCAEAQEERPPERHRRRIGGDEFVIIVEAIQGARHADAVALAVRRALARSLTLARHKVNVTVSIGISFYPESGGDPDALLRAADHAMYLAKRAGGNRHLACLPGMLPPGGGPLDGPPPVNGRNPLRDEEPSLVARKPRRRSHGRRRAGSTRTDPRSPAAAHGRSPRDWRTR